MANLNLLVSTEDKVNSEEGILEVQAAVDMVKSMELDPHTASALQDFQGMVQKYFVEMGQMGHVLLWSDSIDSHAKHAVLLCKAIQALTVKDDIQC